MNATLPPGAARLAPALTLLLTVPALAGCFGPAAVEAEPSTASADGEGELREFDLYVIEDFEWRIAGKRVFTFRFSLTPDGPGTIPGPEIRVTEGDRVRVRLHSAFHTIHWHGVSVPWEMDGVPWMTQAMSTAPGVYTYEFVAHETGTYWYHCHVDAPVHVDLGMFGAFIVEPRAKDADPPFDREATLILHEFDTATFAVTDTAFTGGTQAVDNRPPNPTELPEHLRRNAYSATDFGAFIVASMTGQSLPWGTPPRDYHPDPSIRYRAYYDTFLINGKSFPDTEPLLVKSGETLRIRLVNAGQLVHTMHLHGHKALVTHKDGTLLASPYWADTVGLFPGERYDIYVKATNPGIWDYHDHGGAWGVGAYAANDGAFPGGMSTMLVYEDFKYAKLPEAEPGERRTSGDYRVFAPSYRGAWTPPGAVRWGDDGSDAPAGVLLRGGDANGASAPDRVALAIDTLPAALR